MAKKLASTAQAKFLAGVFERGKIKMLVRWTSGKEVYTEPTVRVCLTRKWIEPVGEESTEHTNGTIWRDHALSDAGVDALEDYLRNARYLRKSAA